jgi:putative nucleotidyltransferase with HDIG domain
MIKICDIEKSFPELEWITDKELKRKVIEVWKKAAEKGGWNRLDEVPFTLLFKNSGKLTEHTRRIVRLVRSVMQTREESLNSDYLLSGAFLHDVGKLLEYEKKGGEVVKSEFGKKKRHPISGSELAKETGLPEEVVHIIYAHSKEGDSIERSPEAIIVHHCDFIDFEIKRCINGNHNRR